MNTILDEIALHVVTVKFIKMQVSVIVSYHLINIIIIINNDNLFANLIYSLLLV